MKKYFYCDKVIVMWNKIGEVVVNGNTKNFKELSDRREKSREGIA